MICFVKTAGADFCTSAALQGLDDHSLCRVTPFGVAQLSEGTHLERVGSPRREVLDHSRRLRTGDEDRSRIHTRAGGRNGNEGNLIVQGLRDRLGRRDYLNRLTLFS